VRLAQDDGTELAWFRRMYVLLELGERVCVICFDERAIALWACDFGTRAVVVAQAVGDGRVLREELKLVEDVIGDGCTWSIP
jgi:hypothetical protein